jgi:hypothetical protein
MAQLIPAAHDELHPFLDRFGRRLRLRDGWLLAQRSLWMPILAALLIAVAGRLWPIPYLWLWMLVPAPFWLGIVLGVALLRPRSPMQIARRVDGELGLKERLSTAVGIVISDQLSVISDQSSLTIDHWSLVTDHSFDPELVARQRNDALAAAQNVDPRRDFPLRILRRPLAAAGMLAAALITLALLPNPMDAILAERAATAAAAEEAADRVEELREEIENAAELTPEERADLARQLAELAEQLRANPGDREEALADLSRLEEELRRQIDADLAARQDALADLAAQLQALAEAQSADAESPADATEALDALAEALAEMSPAEREALARSLTALAGQAAQAGEADLAQSLAELAQAAQSGDSTAAAQSARSVEGALSESERDISAQSRLQQTLDQISAARQAMAGSGSRPSTGTAQAPGSGQNPGQNPGNNPGQGQNAGSGGGSQANRLPDATRSGQAGRPQGPGRSAAEGAEDQSVYVPWERRGGGEGERRPEVGFIPGQDTGQGETQVRERQEELPGSAAPPLVPYQEVYGDYLDSATQALERESIPAGLREYVREYFTQLEP